MPGKKRVTIGVLTNELVTPIYKGLLLGVADAARDRDVNVISFAGGVVDPPTLGRNRNRIYDLVNRNNVDGLIVPISPLTRYLNPTQIQIFLGRFSDLPVINIGSRFAGIPSIAPDFRPGLEKLMGHLILHHGYRKIAMIRGPQSHLASEARYQVYRELLAQYEIEFRPELVVTVDLTKDGGIQAVAALKEQNGLDCDVILVAGDQMLLRVIRALREAGYRVPEDFKVVGLLGVADSDYFDPPLTVVNEGIYDQAQLGLEQLLRMIRGQAVPEVTYLPTELIIRESCGCKHYGGSNITPNPTVPLEEALKRQRREILHMVTQVVANASANQRFRLKERELERILAALITDLSAERETSAAFETAIAETLLDISRNQQVLNRALLSIYKFGAENADEVQARRWTLLWNRVLVLMNEILEHANHLLENKIIVMADIDRRMSMALFPEYRLGLFKEILVDLGINDCYLVSYDDPKQPDGTGRLSFAYANGQELPLPERVERFAVSQFLPNGVLDVSRRFTLVVEPLYSRNLNFGYSIMSMDIRDLTFYAVTQAHLSGALNNLFQMQELQAAEQRFSDIAYSSSDWLWETDAAGRFTYCSEGVYGVLGYEAAEMIGRTLFDFLAPTETEYRSLIENEVFKNKERIRNLENWNLHKDGRPVGLLISGTPVLKEDGTLCGYRGLFKDVTERMKAEAEIRQIAFYDRLTGLPNRTLWMARLEEAFVRAEQGADRFALLFVDLDRFKNVNDNHGHEVGDRLLQLVAERLKNSIRDSDILARLGGDEFVVLLNEIHDSDEVINICKRIFANLESQFELNGYRCFVTCSIGIAIYPHDGSDPQTLLKNADTAMYRSKGQGRNQFIFYDEEMEARSITWLQLDRNLHQALRREELFLMYQPQVNAASGKIIGFEALLRWNNREFGQIEPLDFIPMAEENGLIVPIGEWVLESVINQISIWREMGLPQLPVAINLSSRQLQNRDLVERLNAIVQKTGANPQLIQLEVTEGAFIENNHYARSTLERFKQLGFRIALDGFGTGYSSLGCLNKLAIDRVKIDRVFFWEIANQPEKSGLLGALQLLTQSLTLELVVTGVETAAQRDLLLGLNCPLMQGFLFSRPLTANQVPDLLQRFAI